MKIFKYFLKKILSSVGYEIIQKNAYLALPKLGLNYTHDLLFTYHSADFLQDKKFTDAYQKGKATDPDGLLVNNKYEIFWRIHVLCWAATYASKLRGDFVDCGVYTGIFAKSIISYTNFNHLNKTYFLLDTFEGLSDKYSSNVELEQENNKKYKIKGNIYENVLQTFKDDKVMIIKGAIPETLSQVTSNAIAFLSIDMNSVFPEIEALNFFWDKMVDGGIVILDDHGYGGELTREQRDAHTNFAKSKGVEILSLPTCQGIIIKK